MTASRSDGRPGILRRYQIRRSVPRPKPYLSAGEVFLYLVMFTALYDSSYSLAAIAFEFIDRAFPDAIDPRRWGDLNDLYGPRRADPETQTPYEYNRLSADAYELCAQFQTTRNKDANARIANAFWNHGPARTCFRIEAHPLAMKVE